MHDFMRTTLDIDDALLAGVQAIFPAGTPKTALIEEGLRRLLAPMDTGSPPTRRRDPRLQRLIDEGRVRAATASGPFVRGPGDEEISLDRLLADIDRDREDR